ncbi:MAG: hypothetical protein WC619_00680 [Patescibacteria group bacterium]
MIKEFIKFDENREDEKRLDNIREEILQLGDIKTITREEVRRIKEKLLAENQGFEQEIEFIFSVIDQMVDQVEYDKLKSENGGKIEGQVSKRLNTSFAESFFLETAYIIQNKDNRKYLSNLFDLCQATTEKLKVTKEWQRTKNGLIGQVGVCNFMERYGLSPRLATPKEDAFMKVDFWGKSEQGETLAVQGKSLRSAERPAYLDSDSKLEKWLGQEEMRSRKGGNGKVLNSLHKVEEDYRRVKKFCGDQPNTRTVAIILPSESLDPINGALDEKYFENFKLNN